MEEEEEVGSCVSPNLLEAVIVNQVWTMAVDQGTESQAILEAKRGEGRGGEREEEGEGGGRGKRKGEKE